jgi:Cys-rich four helix bundle protein (predicted Tat secretion target)
MNRRELLVGAGAVMVAAAAKAEQKAKPTQSSGPNALLDAAIDCQKKAELCLSHCNMMFGDVAMAACAASVRDTLATSKALATLAAANSKHVKDLAKVCASVCKDCETECRKHEAKMAPCKDCADACAKMIQEIAKLS